MAKKRSLIRPHQYTVEVLGRRFPVNDMRDASNKVAYLRDKTNMGASEMGGQFPVRDGDVIIGYVSYNAKVWKGLPDLWDKAELMYDPYQGPRAATPEQPDVLAARRAAARPRIEPTCWAHRDNKDYTRRGELFARCGWCDARRVEKPADLNPRRNPGFPERRCDLHEEIEECRRAPSSCRWAGCDGTNEQGDPVCKTPARHYGDTKSFFCDQHRKEFLRDYRWDDDEGWIERRKSS